MENSNNNKRRFYALYLYQMVLRASTHDSLSTIDGEHIDYHCYDSDCLELTPLSSISDEDAMEVVKIANSWDKESHLLVEDVEEWIYEIMTGNCATSADYVSGVELLQLTDFLRSKGYALPYLDASVSDLENMGWIKIKN